MPDHGHGHGADQPSNHAVGGEGRAHGHSYSRDDCCCEVTQNDAHHHNHGHGGSGQGAHGHGHGHGAAAALHREVGIRCGGALAFRGENGEMEFYAPPDGIKVEDLCFEAHGDSGLGDSHPCCEDSTPHIHAHVRADGECHGHGHTVALRKRDGPPLLRDEDLLPPDILSSRSRLVHGQLRRNCEHPHTAEECGHTAIQHGDHIDYLVPAPDGSVELHHPTVIDGVATCIVHGVLRPTVIVQGVLRPKNSVPAPGWQRYAGEGDSSWNRGEDNRLVPAVDGNFEVHHPTATEGRATVVVHGALNRGSEDGGSNGPWPADQPGAETSKGLCCAASRGPSDVGFRPYLFRPPNASERNLFLILVEIYDPKTIAFKVFPTATMRVGKTLALVFNEGVGRALCRWQQGESKLLDAIGEQTAAMCTVLYKEEITEPLVHDFLRRRFLFCLLTATATALQIMMHLVFEAPQMAALITVLLAPITLIDRQFATLVTKNTPRYERSQMLRMVNALYAALRGHTKAKRSKPGKEGAGGDEEGTDKEGTAAKKAAGAAGLGPYPDLEPPARYKMYKYPIINLTHLEMLCGATQFLCGVVVALYMVLLLPAFRDEETGENETLGRYFDMGDDRCDRLGRLLCYQPDVLVTLLRCVKELTNFLSPWIEWRLTPLKYSNNSNYFQDNVEAILEHASGVGGGGKSGAEGAGALESIKSTLDPAGPHADARAAVGVAVERFLVDDGKLPSCCGGGGGSASVKSAAGADAAVGSKHVDGTDIESGGGGGGDDGGDGGPNKLPSYVRRCNLNSRAVGLLAVLYECAGRPPPFPTPGTRFITSKRRLWRVSQEGGVELTTSVVLTQPPSPSRRRQQLSKAAAAGGEILDEEQIEIQPEPSTWKPASGGPIYFGP